MAAQAGKKDAQARREQIAKLRAEQARNDRKRKLFFGVGAGVLVAALVGTLVWLGVSKNSTSTAAAGSSSSALAATWDGLTGQTVDGIAANTSEQLVYHIHAHLTIYVNGTQKAVPAGIGIVKPWSTAQQQDGSTFVSGGAKIYYVHTHTGDGIVHIESPTHTTYTLGQFFAEWNQPISAARVGPSTGAVTAYVNGTRYTGDQAQIALDAHSVIQLNVGKDVAFTPFAFPSGL